MAIVVVADEGDKQVTWLAAARIIAAGLDPNILAAQELGVWQ
jgi:hypothetical protein